MSLKPHLGRSWKRARRIEIVSLLESAFVSDADIAAHLGLTVQALHHIKKSPEYFAKRISASTGVLSVYEQALFEDSDIQKQELNSMVPLALQAAKNILRNPMHPAYAKVALDLLDRNKSTSKISRTEHSLAAPPELSAENKRAKELLGILEATGETPLNQFIQSDTSKVEAEENNSSADELTKDAEAVQNYRPKSYSPDLTSGDDSLEEGAEGSIQ